MYTLTHQKIYSYGHIKFSEGDLLLPLCKSFISLVAIYCVETKIDCPAKKGLASYLFVSYSVLLYF